MSPPPSEDDECACRVCRFTFGLDLPVVNVESLADLQAQTKELSVAIFRHWILLNKTLKRCEDVIQKRWMKKNNSQRLAILLAAWPGMAATHRPDFASLRDISDKGCRRRLNREKEREYNLWPFVNQEDLIQPSNLLMFLNSRGRCLPDKFAFGDKVLTHAGNTSSCKSDDINERRMVLHGKKTPASYGALSTFVEGDDIDMLGMHPQTGLLVLEIQERILHFLVNCCRFILHDMEIAKMDLRPTEKAKMTASTSLPTWRTMTALTNEAPYRLPQQLDLDRLCMLVEAKRSEAEEHIWSMREDPGYFASQVQDWADHTTEMVLDKYKMRHSSVGKPAFWSRLCKSVVTHAYRSLIYFDELYNQLDALARLTKKHEKQIHPTKRLPPSLEESYQRLDKLVEEMRHGPLNDLVVGHPASPPMRSGFERSVHDRMPSYHNLISKVRRGPAWRVQVLFRALLSEDQHKKHGLVNIIGEIQRTLDEHSADSDAITPWVADRFADLALVVEVRHQLDLFQPWSTMWRHNSDPVLQEMDFEGTALVHDVIDEAIACVKLDVDPSNLAYPSEKRRTEATVKRMRESEKALDLMWKKIDKHAAVHTGYTLHVFLTDFIREGKRRLQRTPAWVEPTKCSSAPTGQQPAAEWILKYVCPAEFFLCSHSALTTEPLNFADCTRCKAFCRSFIQPRFSNMPVTSLISRRV